MAEPGRTQEIIDAVQARLREILVANGYRTDAGADVRTEPTMLNEDGVSRITIFSGGRVRPSDAGSKVEREFTLVIEAQIAARLDNAQARTIAVDEDLEEALADHRLQLPWALPLEFQESLILERPDGHPIMVVQQMYTTRFRR